MISFKDRTEAIEFCKERKKMHEYGAYKIAKENDIIEDEIMRTRYNSSKDLANRYADIVELLSAETKG